MGIYYIAYDLGGRSLVHSGVLNMKWHKRRWQNYDGSLTPAGRIHYGVGPPRAKSAEKAGSPGRANAKQEGLFIRPKTSEEKAAIRAAKADRRAAKKAQREAKKAAKQAAKEQKEAEKKAAEEMEKQLAEEQQRKAKEDQKEALRQYIRHNPTQIDKFTDAFTREEMEDLISQVNFDQRVKDMSTNQRMKQIEKYNNYANKVVNVLNTVKNGGEAAIAIYNQSISTYNTVGKAKAEKEGKEFKPLPRIGGNNDGDKQRDKQKNQQQQPNGGDQQKNQQQQPNDGDQQKNQQQQHNDGNRKKTKAEKRAERAAREAAQQQEAEKIREEARNEVKREDSVVNGLRSIVGKEVAKAIKSYENADPKTQKKMREDLMDEIDRLLGR